MRFQGGHRRPAPSRAELDTSFQQCSQVTVLRVPAPPRRVFRRSGQWLRELSPAARVCLDPASLFQNPLLTMATTHALRSLVVLQVLGLALAQIVSPAASLAPKSWVQSLGLGSRSLGICCRPSLA